MKNKKPQKMSHKGHRNYEHTNNLSKSILHSVTKWKIIYGTFTDNSKIPMVGS